MAIPTSKAAHREPPTLVPPDAAELKIRCGACGAVQNVDWFEKQPFPAESIESTTSDGHWVPTGFVNTCLECKNTNVVSIEATESKGCLLISGDEASRDVGDIHFFALAGCGIAHTVRSRLQTAVSAIESQLSYESGGRITAFHAKSIMNEWPDASFARRAKFIKKMAFAARSITVTKFVTAGAVYNNKTSKMHKNIRDQVFSAYVMRVLHLTRIHGIIPRFAFDQVQRGKRSGWADECMTGIRRSPFFIWASKGAHIEPIQYVEPGATLESKIADCLAFVTAREFARRFSARDVDVNSKWFGHTHYSGFNGRGDLIPRDGVGFPWKAVFGLNEGR